MEIVAAGQEQEILQEITQTDHQDVIIQIDHQDLHKKIIQKDL